MKPLRGADLAKAVIYPIIWGSNNSLTAIPAKEASPVVAALLRFILSMIVDFRSVYAFFKQLRSSNTSAAIWQICCLAGPVQYFLLYESLRLAESVAVITIVLQSYIPLQVLAGTLLLNDRASGRLYIGLSICIAGMLIVILLNPGHDRALASTSVSRQSVAVALALLSTVGAASQQVLPRYFKEHRHVDVDPTAISTGIVVMTAVLFAALLAVRSIVDSSFYLTTEIARLSSYGWSVLVFSATLSNIFALRAAVYIGKKYEPSQYVYFGFLSPVAAIVVATAFLGDDLGYWLLGVPLVLLGIHVCRSS